MKINAHELRFYTTIKAVFHRQNYKLFKSKSEVFLLELTQLTLNRDGSTDVKTGNAKENDFEILARYWATDDNHIIRGWTAEEYVECYPQDKKEMAVKIAGAFVSPNTNCYSRAQAHCVEARRAYARKQGAKIFSFDYYFDYSKQ